MPVPVPLYDTHTAHQVHKRRTDSFGRFAFRGQTNGLGDGSKYVSPRQADVRHWVDPQGFHLLIQQDLSHCIGDRLNSAIHLVESQHPSKVAEPHYGLAPAADADFSQEHAEACSSPVRELALSNMTIFPNQRGASDIALSGYDAMDGIVADVNGWETRAPFVVGGEPTFYPVCSSDGLNQSYGYSQPQPCTTPFAEFVDRMAACDAGVVGEHTHIARNAQAPEQAMTSPVAQHRAAIQTEPLSNPVYIKTYRSMAESLANWIANYVWKACASDVNFGQRSYGASRLELPSAPSTVLIKSINNVLCSTLLQPSAIFLALWYMSRLPIHFEDEATSGRSAAQEEFRRVLFGDLSALSAPERQNELRRRIPFRIALLGFMLANKWLDDHTFSNKTWQSVSEEPIKAINRLEFAALAALRHDLSVSPKAWEAWLYHLQHYQATNHPFPSPIGRPSATDSNALVRKMISDLINLQKQRLGQGPVSDPLFSTLLTCEIEREDVLQQVKAYDPFDINLDEDGPLKEEYIPKRRSSLHGHNISDRQSLTLDLKDISFQSTPLPPPSEWSPQGDPPLQTMHRARSTSIARNAPGHGRSASVSLSNAQSWSNGLSDKGLLQQGFSMQSKSTPAWPPFNQSQSTGSSGVSVFPPPYGAHIQQPLVWTVPADVSLAPVYGCGRYIEQPPPYSHLSGEMLAFRPLWLRS